MRHHASLLFEPSVRSAVVRLPEMRLRPHFLSPAPTTPSCYPIRRFPWHSLNSRRNSIRLHGIHARLSCYWSRKVLDRGETDIWLRDTAGGRRVWLVRSVVRHGVLGFGSGSNGMLVLMLTCVASCVCRMLSGIESTVVYCCSEQVSGRASSIASPRQNTTHPPLWDHTSCTLECCHESKIQSSSADQMGLASKWNGIEIGSRDSDTNRRYGLDLLSCSQLPYYPWYRAGRTCSFRYDTSS